MEIFSASLASVRGNHRSPVNPLTMASDAELLMFSLICAWTNSWINNGDAGDLRRHNAHCEVTVMSVFIYYFRGPLLLWNYLHPILDNHKYFISRVKYTRLQLNFWTVFLEAHIPWWICWLDWFVKCHYMYFVPHRPNFDLSWCKYNGLYFTHLPLDKTAAVLQTIFSGAFSWLKSFVFRFEFHCRRVQVTISQHWFR